MKIIYTENNSMGYYIADLQSVNGKTWVNLNNCISKKWGQSMPLNQFIKHFKKVEL